jgi:hypothetical protein
MVRAAEVAICQPEFDLKLGDELDLFNPTGYDLPQLQLGALSDESPPETPCPSTAAVSHPPYLLFVAFLFFFPNCQKPCVVIGWLQ